MYLVVIRMTGGKESKSVRTEKTQIGKIRGENPTHVPQDHPGCKKRTAHEWGTRLRIFQELQTAGFKPRL